MPNDLAGQEGHPRSARSHPKRIKHVCLITGASRGIGREIALALAPECEEMLLVSRKVQELEAVRSAVMKVSSVTRVRIVSADLTQEEDLQSVVSAANAMGRLTLLIHNAGVSDFSDLQRQSDLALEGMIWLNLVAPIRLTQRLLPLLQHSVPSQVISVGSSFGTIGYPGFSVYCAAKAGLRGFTEALDRELSGTGIRARIFSPRATATEINSQAVRDMNRSLGVTEDDPKKVANLFKDFVGGHAREYRVGFPESLFARINLWFPSLVDQAIRQQLPKIRAALQAGLIHK
jgi:short-subunit dehydrogenase